MKTDTNYISVCLENSGTVINAEQSSIRDINKTITNWQKCRLDVKFTESDYDAYRAPRTN